MSFFFSSRRRHTRLQGDWSSDVCSSDLTMRLYCREAAMICCASNMLYEQGFSTKTSLPACTAQIVCNVWWKFGVARDTRSEERRVGKECRAGVGWED